MLGEANKVRYTECRSNVNFLVVTLALFYN